MDSKGSNLADWQLDEADIAATHGNHAQAIVELRRLLQQVETEDPHHTFSYISINGSFSPNWRATMLRKVTLLKLTNGSNAALLPLTLPPEA